MSLYTKTFNINKSEKIIFTISELSKHIDYLTIGEIYLVSDNHSTLLHSDTIIPALERFQKLLYKAINFDLQLHPSIKHDIGYMYNEDLQWTFNKNINNRPQQFIYEHYSGGRQWIGHRYDLWSDQLQTWLYNKSNKIILEVTPVYPWYLQNKKHIAPYHEWIKTYSPYFKKTIPQKTAQKLFNQLQNILSKITDATQ